MRGDREDGNRLFYLDYIFVLRPMLFFPGWSTFLAGYLISVKSQLIAPVLIPPLPELVNLIVIALGFTFAMGSGFIINQVYDVASDRENKKLFIISDGHLSLRNARIEAWLLALLACSIPFLINLQSAIAIIVFFIITGIIYNISPFRMKDRPIGSLLANAAMGWLAFAIGWLVGNNLEWRLFVDALPYLLFNTALYLYTTLPDIEGDRIAGKKTLAVQLGIGKIANTAFILVASSLICAWMLDDHLALFFSILTVPLAFIPVMTEKITDTIRATKYAVLFFALAVCLKLPLYFLLMAGGFYFTRYYFKHRFKFDYPTFKGQ